MKELNLSITKDPTAHYRPDALAIQIAQVGKNQHTTKFLNTLHNDIIFGNIIDCTSYYELEKMEFMRKGISLSPQLWLIKVCIGAIDKSYDELEEFVDEFVDE
jgi:hypothetical protein